MKVRILTGVGGHDFSWAPGQVVDLPEEEAAKWADGERGEAIEEEELASSGPVELDPEKPVTVELTPAEPEKPSKAKK